MKSAMRKFVFAMIASVATSALATDYTFQGGDVNNPGSWLPEGVPTETDNVIFASDTNPFSVNSDLKYSIFTAEKPARTINVFTQNADGGLVITNCLSLERLNLNSTNLTLTGGGVVTAGYYQVAAGSKLTVDNGTKFYIKNSPGGWGDTSFGIVNIRLTVKNNAYVESIPKTGRGMGNNEICLIDGGTLKLNSGIFDNNFCDSTIAMTNTTFTFSGNMPISKGSRLLIGRNVKLTGAVSLGIKEGYASFNGEDIEWVSDQNTLFFTSTNSCAEIKNGAYFSCKAYHFDGSDSKMILDRAKAANTYHSFNHRNGRNSILTLRNNSVFDFQRGRMMLEGTNFTLRIESGSRFDVTDATYSPICIGSNADYTGNYSGGYGSIPAYAPLLSIADDAVFTSTNYNKRVFYIGSREEDSDAWPRLHFDLTQKTTKTESRIQITGTANLSNKFHLEVNVPKGEAVFGRYPLVKATTLNIENFGDLIRNAKLARGVNLEVEDNTLYAKVSKCGLFVIVR